MNPDLTLLSDKDLEALSAGKIDLMSDAGLAILAGEAPAVEKKKPDAKQLLKEAVLGKEGQKKGGLEVGTIDDFLRGLGLTARGALQGAVALPAMAADIPAGIVNLAAGRQVYKPQAEAFGGLLTALGVPEPKSSAERMVAETAGAGAGVAAPSLLAQKLTQAATPAVSSVGRELAKSFSENVPAQFASALGGTMAAGGLRESGASPTMQMLGSVAGAMAPGAASAGLPAAGRAIRETVKPFTEAGREVIAGNVLRQLSNAPEQAVTAMESYKPNITGYTPTTAQASRDVGLIAAETPIRALDTTGKFAKQASEANQARMSILDRLAKDKADLEAAVTKRTEVTKPMREEAFANVNVDPETFQSAVTLNVNKTIDDILASDAGARGTVKKTMQWAQEQVKSGTTPSRLYEVRKDLRDAAQGLLDKEGAAYSLAKGQLEQVIKSVDDTIEAAAPGYKAYLDKFAKSSKGIERMEAAQEFRGKVLSTTPDPSNVGDYMISQPSFTRAIRAAEKDTKLSDTQLAVLKKVSADLDAGVLNRAGKVPGSDTFKNMSTANVIGGIIGKSIYGEVPAAVNKLASPMNWLFNGTDDQIRELLVDAMLDPKLASKLMGKASVMSIEPLSQELKRKAIASGYGAAFGLEQPYKIDLTGMSPAYK